MKTTTLSSLTFINLGLKKFNNLIEKKSFWYSYIFFIGFFDLALALYETKNPDNIMNALKLNLYIGGNLIILFTVFILLIIRGNQEILGKKLLNNLWRVWAANFIAGFWILLGTICLVIPGIILYIRYIYINEIILFEQSTIPKALSKSRDLVKYNGGKVIKACIIVFLISLFISFIASLILSLIDESIMNSFLFNYLSSVIGSLIAVLFTTIVYTGYLDAESQYTKES